ncbi:MAG: oligosaccharide flippase family protein [Solirubrobacterales bacterium]
MTERPLTPPSIIEDDAVEAAIEPLEERLALGGRTLREHTAWGGIVNSLFQVGLAFFGLLQRVAVAAFLTTSEYGLWGLLIATLITLSWLKQVGISDKYVQQDEGDQELAFQKAFTLELAYTGVFLVLALAAMPLYALLYGRPEILVPGMVLCAAFLTTALHTPIWIAYRQMRFVRQRTLEAIDPVIAGVVTIALAAAGLGYWSLIIGVLVGSVCGAIAAIVTCPYPIRLRYDRGTLREYFSFSWPLLLAGASSLVIVQGAVVVGNFTVGLAGLGALALATNFAMFADRVDMLIRRTIYPAVAAVKDRTDLLFETFTKSNRLALMWAMPFGVALALFAPDLVTHVLGERWREAETLLQAFGLILAFRQVAFNWTVFFNAVGQTRPMAINGAVAVVIFALVTAPLMLWIGLDGYIIGMSVAVAVDIGLRGYFLSRLFRGFHVGRHLVRAVAPSVPATVLILGVRAAVDAERTLGLALAELGLYALATVAATWIFERQLLTEVLGYLRRAVRPSPAGSAGERAAAA